MVSIAHVPCLQGHLHNSKSEIEIRVLMSIVDSVINLIMRASICVRVGKIVDLLEEARKLTSSREILLWMTPSEAPKALQASERSELLARLA